MVYNKGMQVMIKDKTRMGVRTAIISVLTLAAGLALVGLRHGSDEFAYQTKQSITCNVTNATTTSPANLQVLNNDNILFKGDSITADYRKPYHYGKIVGLLLDKSYCDLTNVSLYTSGSKGKSYANYAHTISRSMRAYPYDIVIAEDAGVSIPSDLFKTSLSEFVSIIRQYNSITVIGLATTPSLEEKAAITGNALKYVAANNWQDHNVLLKNFVDSDPSLGLIPWRSNSCQAYTKGSDIVYTVDGIHPTPRGHLLYALSILKWFGVTEAQLNFSDLPTLDSSLDIATAKRIASWVYGPQDATCGGLAPLPARKR